MRIIRKGEIAELPLVYQFVIVYNFKQMTSSYILLKIMPPAQHIKTSFLTYTIWKTVNF